MPAHECRARPPLAPALVLSIAVLQDSDAASGCHRLIDRLGQLTERKPILVSAPAGASDRTAGWVSLHETDKDPALFWAYVITALQQVQFEVGERALALLYSPQPLSIESVLTTLINEPAFLAIERSVDAAILTAGTILDVLPDRLIAM
jgi:hypothetical protein